MRVGGIFEFDLIVDLMVRDVAEILFVTSPLPFGGRTALPGALVLPTYYLIVPLVLALLVSWFFVTAVVD